MSENKLFITLVICVLLCVVESVDYKKLCEKSVCIPKCCPDNYYIFGYHKKCLTRGIDGIRKTHNFSDVPIFNDSLRKTGKFLVNFTFVPGRFQDEEFNRTAYDYSELKHRYYITQDGFLYEEMPNKLNRFTKLNRSEYCVDYQRKMPLQGVKNHQLKFYIRFPEPEFKKAIDDNPVITYGLAVSCFFLTLVLIVYSLLRELRNLSGMVLMAYVASLLGSFVLLCVMQIGENYIDVCKGLTYATYFCLLASFCWMNIMSCDIWWTFRGYAKARPIHRRGEPFKFFLYCLYAFGLPGAMTVMVIVTDSVDMRHLPWFVTPGIGQEGCFLANDAKLVYLYIPMLLMIVCNWIFFLMTAFNIWRLHRATAVLDSAAAGTPAAHRSQKYRFLVYLKLSVIMGINWVMEVASSFSPDFKGWYISDVYNMLIGLSIFLIFVCKKQILRKLVKRLGSFSDWQSRPWYTRSRSSNTTESEVTEVPVCANPKGPALAPVFFDKR
ncbi:7 transmembrane receptor (Secretin family) domain-containing protein [Phthorimaea operculella]|nr:7 transmembrane receptor (Secretin family) domain-containing protein [Phthorimaea operculella]